VVLVVEFVAETGLGWGVLLVELIKGRSRVLLVSYGGKGAFF